MKIVHFAAVVSVCALPAAAQPQLLRAPLPPNVAWVKVNNGDVEITFPARLGGGAVAIADGLRGTYVRAFDPGGLTFSIELMALYLPSFQLPNGQITGPITIRTFPGDFHPASVARFGVPNRGVVLRSRQVLEETLGLEVYFPLLTDLGEAPLSVLLGKREEGYDEFSGGSVSWRARGVVTSGMFEGTQVAARGSCKSSDYRFPVCKAQRISTGFGTSVTKCGVAPAATATCTVSNLLGAGGVLVHCNAKGVAVVTITFQDAMARERVVARSVHCE
jgi:hypothetical protein